MGHGRDYNIEADIAKGIISGERGVRGNERGSLGNPDAEAKKRIFEELNMLNAQACELIDQLHGTYEASVEGKQSQTGVYISQLVKAYQDFLDCMRIYELDQRKMTAMHELEKINHMINEHQRRIDDRSELKRGVSVDPFA